MCKKIILISSFICLCAGFQCVAQSIKTNLYVTTKSCNLFEEDPYCPPPHTVEVTQEFVLEKFSTDTLFLQLENTHWMQPFAYPQLFPKMTVDIISENKKQSVEPDFNGRTLSVPLPTSSCTITL
ncbi:MAG: hypothetical protein LBV02_01150 [Bacteroidales bacterium]|jgi:hypothetical protein|nr:hypothetical protein [Bacteroidales bacterium]